MYTGCSTKAIVNLRGCIKTKTNKMSQNMFWPTVYTFNYREYKLYVPSGTARLPLRACATHVQKYIHVLCNSKNKLWAKTFFETLLFSYAVLKSTTVLLEPGKVNSHGLKWQSLELWCGVQEAVRGTEIVHRPTQMASVRPLRGVVGQGRSDNWYCKYCSAIDLSEFCIPAS